MNVVSCRPATIRRRCRRLSTHLFLMALFSCVVAACGSSTTSLDRGMARQSATNLPEFDVQACFPPERDWGGDAKLQGMWVAVSDAFPRLNECVNDHFFKEGAFEGQLDIILRVQPDHSVALLTNTDIENERFKGCVDEALAMIELPNSSEPSGQEFHGSYPITQEGPDALTVDGSLLGKLVGSIRSEAIGMCGCLEPYKDSKPPAVKFKFDLKPNSVKPQNPRLVTKNIDPAFAGCLQEHLQTVSIGKVDEKITGGYRFKFRNSRVRDASSLVRDAGEHANRGEYAQARLLFEQALQLDPEDISTLNGLANVLATLGEPAEVRAVAQKILDLAPDDASGLYLMARSYTLEDKCAEALPWADKAVEADDENPFRAQQLQAHCLLELDRPEEARDAANAARMAQPTYALAWIAEADAAHRLGDSDEALELLDQATRLDLLDPDSWNGLAIVYLDIGEAARALDALTTARARGFSTPTIIFNQAVALQRLGRDDEAAATFCEAADKDPANASFAEACGREALDDK